MRACHAARAYHPLMGSSGMKRKGRTHLPKAGTRASDQQELHDRRERALHPFAEDPWRRGISRGWITGIALGIVAVVGFIGWIIFT